MHPVNCLSPLNQSVALHAKLQCVSVEEKALDIPDTDFSYQLKWVTGVYYHDFWQMFWWVVDIYQIIDVSRLVVLSF